MKNGVGAFHHSRSLRNFESRISNRYLLDYEVVKKRVPDNHDVHGVLRDSGVW